MSLLRVWFSCGHCRYPLGRGEKRRPNPIDKTSWAAPPGGVTCLNPRNLITPTISVKVTYLRECDRAAAVLCQATNMGLDHLWRRNNRETRASSVVVLVRGMTVTTCDAEHPGKTTDVGIDAGTQALPRRGSKERSKVRRSAWPPDNPRATQSRMLRTAPPEL